MKHFQKLVFTPDGHPDPALAIAASRAGAIGVFNAENQPDESLVVDALDRMANYARNAYGIRLGSRSTDELLQALSSRYSRGLSWVVVDPAIAISARDQLQAFRTLGGHVLVEVVKWDALSTNKLQAEYDGWIVKGHESGGLVSEETTFILLQKALAASDKPVYARGGIGMHSAAACYIAGAAGVVLDNQLLLLRESPLREFLEPLVSKLVGNETVAIGDPEKGMYYRVLERPGFSAVKSLRQKSATTPFETVLAEAKLKSGWGDTSENLLPLGQDVAFAASWKESYASVSSALQALDRSVAENSRLAQVLRPLSADSPLAVSHGTRYPIVQGPMTRVSDSAKFAADVSQAGGLPMLAFALMKGPAVRELLEETTALLGSNSWGVGLLGFAPAELLQEQISIAREFNPAYALIAGGRPEQAIALEEVGVPSYLHVPSPRLLSMFLQRGARRFVFEGRECGGHIGPLTSFILWESMVVTLLQELPTIDAPEDIHILFAGGVHDGLSAAMVATISAPLAEKGVKIGVLMGSAYLLTEEIVQSGAIIDTFQSEALNCRETIGCETGTGHASRCSDTAFAKEFVSMKKSMLAEGRDADEIRDVLENLNLGRLRLASKGVERGGGDNGLLKVSKKRRRDEGMYMIGQVATLKSEIVSVEELHRSVIDGACEQIDAGLLSASDDQQEKIEDSKPCDIAIIGIGACLPKASDAKVFWDNIVNTVDAVTEIPADRWDWRLYFDENRQAKDKIYSRWGGFLEDMVFDPVQYGIPPNAIRAIDPLQLMTLEVMHQTLADSGYGDREFDREKVSVILGASGGAGDVGAQYAVRAEMPRFLGELPDEVAERLPEWTEDSFAGILLNVAAGRAANRFDFGGLNFTVDAACASSLASIHQAVVELEDGRSDMAIAGGIDTVQGPFGYLCFSRTQALSPRGKCRTFDTSADGIVISEGIAMVCMKRLADAERDGDRIYAVIKGVGGSSDGRAKSMTAPHPDGQVRALERAYQKAGYSAASVGLFEAHGTGTVAGDTAELETVTRMLKASNAQPKQHAIGSVKTLIGHTKASAGVAGLIKSCLALYHRTLPPHANVDVPNERIADPDSPLYIVQEAKPWVTSNDAPRRSGVSAFGFGGTNFHVTMEEYQDNYLLHENCSPWNEWPAEIFVWRAADKAELLRQIQSLFDSISTGAEPCLRDLSFTLAASLPAAGMTAALVATSIADLKKQLQALVVHLQDETKPLPPSINYTEQPLGDDGKIALIFAGQGSQYPNMLRQLALAFPEMRAVLEKADQLLSDKLARVLGPGTSLSRAIYPSQLYTPEEEAAAAGLLTRTEVTQPALGVVEVGLYHLLQRCGLKADMAGGHSYGEFVALYTAGVMSLDDLLLLSEARGRFISESGNGKGLGTMAAVSCERAVVEKVAEAYPDLVVANHNAPEQSIISGSHESIDAVVQTLTAQGIEARKLQVGAAFHSSFVSEARNKFAEFMRPLEMQAPQFPVYSNTTAAAHSSDIDVMRDTLAKHLSAPVEFVAEIEAMYEAGARIFVGVGPKNVQPSLVSQILGERTHRVVRMDDHSGGLKGLLMGLATLLSEDVTLDIMPMFSGRDCRMLDLKDLTARSRKPDRPRHAWLLNGGGAHPVNEVGRPPLTIEDVESAARHPISRQDIAPESTQHRETFAETNNRRAVIPGEDVMSTELNNEISTATYIGADENLMTAYLDTMGTFLQVQENVMLAYLSGASPTQHRTSHQRPARAPNRLPVPQRLPASVAPQSPAVMAGPNGTPAAVVMPNPGADQSQDQIQQKPAPAPAPVTNTAPVASTESAAGSEAIKLDFAGVSGILLDIVEDRTGYPQDMLGLDVNMEAELGIDSIKRVEIVGTLVSALPNGVLDSSDGSTEQLNSMKTLKGMIDFIVAEVGQASPAT